MAMLTTLKSLVGDAFSGPVKDQRISLSQEQAALLDRELVKSHTEIASLTIRVSELATEVVDLKSKLAQYEQASDSLDETACKVLTLLFKADGGMARGSIRAHFGIEEGVAMFHLDTLKELDFIGHKRGREPLMGVYSEGRSFMPRGVPEKFFIKSKGRAYIMKNG